MALTSHEPTGDIVFAPVENREEKLKLIEAWIEDFVLDKPTSNDLTLEQVIEWMKQSPIIKESVGDLIANLESQKVSNDSHFNQRVAELRAKLYDIDNWKS